MIGRRCKMGCEETWPDKSQFAVCPRCEEPTQRYKNMKPLTRAEAESAVKHLEFEKFYETEYVRDSEPLTPAELEKLGLK